MRKTVLIGAIYDDCVRAGDVYSVLDDGRRNQNVILIIDEIEHHSFHIFFVHLTMSDGQPCLWDQAMHQRGDGLNRFNAVVNKENLSAPLKFQFDC